VQSAFELHDFGPSGGASPAFGPSIGPSLPPPSTIAGHAIFGQPPETQNGLPLQSAQRTCAMLGHRAAPASIAASEPPPASAIGQASTGHAEAQKPPPAQPEQETVPAGHVPFGELAVELQARMAPIVESAATGQRIERIRAAAFVMVIAIESPNAPQERLRSPSNGYASCGYSALAWLIGCLRDPRVVGPA
jgi:hypothetical protein